MIRSGERGSVVGFVVVGALLAALVLGGIYAAKHLIAGKLSSTATQVATTAEQTADDAKNAVSDASQTNDTNNASEQEAAKQNEANNTQENDENADAVGDDSESESELSSEQATEVPQTGVSSEQTSNATVLPQTGPVESAVMALSISVLIGAIVAYRRSLRV